MNILLTNDDGIAADGIRAAFDALSDLATVTVVAPRDACSGASHALTIRAPIEVEEVAMGSTRRGLAITGTPADAVKLGIKMLLAEPPDLVVSGINAGLNFGFNSFYSGTVSAAVEGVIMGVPSLAVSLDVINGGDFEDAGAVLHELVKSFQKSLPPADQALSVNVPAQFSSSPPEYALTRHSTASLIEVYHPSDADPAKSVFVLGRESVSDGVEPESDIAAVREGLVSVARLSPDINACLPSREIEQWLIECGLKIARNSW